MSPNWLDAELRLDQVWLLVSPGNPLKPRHAAWRRSRDRLAGAAAHRRWAAGLASGDRGRVSHPLYRRHAASAAAAGFRGCALSGSWAPIFCATAALAALAEDRAAFAVRRAAKAGLHASGACRTGGASAYGRGAGRRVKRPLLPGAAPGWVFLPAPAESTVSATAIRTSRRRGTCYSQAAQTARLACPASAGAEQESREAGAAGGTRGRPAARARRPSSAGPKKAGDARRAKVEDRTVGTGSRCKRLIVTSLEDDKAENVITLDLAGKAMFCDRMVIASGLADRQISAMAQHLTREAARGRPEARADRGRRRLRLGADRCRRHRGASVQAGGADDVRAGEDVGRGPGRGGRRLTSYREPHHRGGPAIREQAPRMAGDRDLSVAQRFRLNRRPTLSLND